MKRILIKILILLLFPVILLGMLRLIENENEYIKLIGVPENGGFILQATGGDPNLSTDDDRFLLFEDYPPTSLTSIYINDRAISFGDERMGYFSSMMAKRGDVLMATYNAYNIDITQIIRIVKGPTTGRLDTMELQYVVANKANRNNNIGIWQYFLNFRPFTMEC